MFKKIVLIATASLIAFAFAGCSKKPRRPNPLDTVMGQGYESGGQSQSDMINPTSLDGSELPERRSGFGGASIEELAARAERNVLPIVYFNFDSSSITPQERTKLDDAASFLNRNPGSMLILEGHCDWRGTTEYNLALGDRRSQSVKDYLETLRVSSDRLQTLSKGDLEATEGASSEQMTRERRVELLVVR